MAKRSQSLKQAAGCAAKLKVLADPVRLAVVEALMAGPKHVGTLQEALKVEQSLLSHHLQTLRDAGLVESERDGKAVLYRMSPDVMLKTKTAIDLGCCQVTFD